MRTANPRGQGTRLREELLDAATRLLERGGRDAELTLRGVAREAGVAAPSVYPHFPDLDALALAVIQRHTADLESAVGRALARGGDRPAVERLRAMARAYVRWGLTHPGPYTVVFEGRALRQLSTQDERAYAEGSTLMASLVAVLAELEEPPADPVLAATATWTGLHGVVSLRSAKPNYPWPGQDRHVEAVLAGLGLVR